MGICRTSLVVVVGESGTLGEDEGTCELGVVESGRLGGDEGTCEPVVVESDRLV